MIQPNLFHIFPKFIYDDETGYAMCKALEAGYKYFLEKAEDGVDCILNPDKMPEWRLDEMAWELNCLYDSDADVEVKREWINNAYKSYRIHGTAEGVRQYLKYYFGESSITELTGTNAFKFDVAVSGLRSDENEAWIRAAVEKAKNVRSILRNIIYNGGESTFSIAAGANCCGVLIVDNCVML